MQQQAINEIRNAVEHALMNDEISIEQYESITNALSKGTSGFEMITINTDIAFLVLP